MIFHSSKPVLFSVPGMLRRASVMFLASSALHATPFVSCALSTPTQTTTVTGNSSCDLGPTASFPYMLQAMAQAGDSISGVDGMVSGATHAQISSASQYSFASYEASAQASDSVEYATSGPARSGFIQLDVTLALYPGAMGDALLSDGVHQYSYTNGTSSTPGTCTFPICEYTATLPFDLGTTFSVSASQTPRLLLPLCRDSKLVRTVVP